MRGGGELVGRDPELAVLRDALGAASDGRGGVVTVSGEPGIGKTAAVRAFAAMAAETAAVGWGTCFEGTSQSPYAEWSTALAGIGAEPVRLDAPPDGLAPPEARLRLFSAVHHALVERSPTAPVVIVIDDLHWASRDGAELFGYVAARAEASRVVVVATFRAPDRALGGDTPLARLLADLPRLGHHRRVHLRGLDVDAVARYLSTAFGDEVPAAIVRAVHEQTAGNPFFVREVVTALVEDGKLVQRDGRWLSDFSIGALRIPDTVRDTVRGRVAALSEPTRALLVAASLFPGDLDLATVADVAGIGDDIGEDIGDDIGDDIGRDIGDEVAVDAVDEALAAGLLLTTGRAGAPYAFAHAIVRHALAESLNPDRAARLHRRAADALQRHRPDDHGAIGEQYWLSRSLPGRERGVEHCLAAAAEAAGRHASQDASRLLELALDLATAGDAATRATIVERLAVAQAEALDIARAPATTLRAVDLLPADRAGALVVRVVEALGEGSPVSAYEPLVRRGLELVGTGDGSASGLALWARLATILDPVETVAAGGLRVGRWVGYAPAAVAALRATGLDDDAARTIQPFLPRSRDETRAFLAQSSAWTSPRARMRALDLAGRDFSLRHGLPLEAVECYRRLLELGERVGSLPAQAEAAGQLALCLALVGDLPGGEAHLARAAVLVRDLWPGHRLHMLGTLSSSAVVACLRGEGDWAGMAERFTGWVRSPAPARAPYAAVFVALAAVCHAFSGSATESRLLLDGLADVLAALDPADHGVAGSLWFATAAVWELHEARAAPRFAALVERHAAAGGPPGPVPLAHAAGRLAALVGDGDRAGELFTSARAAAEESGTRSVGVLVDYDDAVVRHDADGIRAAGRRFEDLGMRGWARRAATAADGATRGPRPAGLTLREVEVLPLLAAGRTSQEIAAQLVVSVPTVNRHVANIYTKIDVRNRAEATSFAISAGLA